MVSGQEVASPSTTDTAEEFIASVHWKKPSAQSEMAAADGITPKPDVPKGMLRVHVQPWGEVHLDGVKRADGQRVVDIAAAPGRHELMVRNPLSEEVRQIVVVPPEGGELRIRLRPLPATLLLQSDQSLQVLASDTVIGEVVGGMPTLLEVPLRRWRGSDLVVLVLQRGARRKEVPLTLEAGRFHSLVVNDLGPESPTNGGPAREEERDRASAGKLRIRPKM
jgi:hypothetical protein